MNPESRVITQAYYLDSNDLGKLTLSVECNCFITTIFCQGIMQRMEDICNNSQLLLIELNYKVREIREP